MQLSTTRGMDSSARLKPQPTDQIEKQFQTNVFGLMNVCREILPYFREQKKGIIVNVASVGGRVTLPLYGFFSLDKMGGRRVFGIPAIRSQTVRHQNKNH